MLIEILNRIEAGQIGNLTHAKLGGTQQLACPFQSDRTDELQRGHIDNGLQFTVQLRTAHPDILAQVRNGIIRIIHILLD